MTLLQTARGKWRKKLRRVSTVGLDIGRHAIKFVAVDRHTESACVNLACTLPVAVPVPVEDGQLQSLLAQVIRDTGLSKGTECIVSLPSSLVDYQTLECPGNLTPEALLDFAQNAMLGLLGCEFDLATFDYWQLDGSQANTIGGASSELHLVWSVAEHANQVTRTLYECGLRPKIVDAPALALGRSASNYSSTGRRLVIDIGCGEVTFVWSNAEGVQYIRNRIKFSNDSASQLLASAHSLDIHAAQQLLKSYGISDKGGNAIAVENFRALEGWLDQLLFEIDRTCQHLCIRHGHSSIDQLWLCGGASCMVGISEWISVRTGIETTAAMLPPECGWNAAEPYSPVYAQAVSLALHGGPS
jgi:Tfp pilus assembly PilM family ATPase